MPPLEWLLKLEHITKAFSGVTVLEDVSLEVRPGEVQALVGENGAGKSTSDLNAVFATNDQMALGAMEALAARNLTGKIRLVGFDAGQEAVRAVKAGQLHAVVAQSPANMGKLAVEAAVKAIKGEPVEKRIDTGTTPVTKENADQFLK